MALDPRSDKVALYYTGTDADREYVSGIPARDLTEADVARELYIRHGQRHLSGAAQEKAVDTLYDQLTAGPYRRTKPESDKPTGKSTPAAAPDSGKE